jgi:hypothetical protein
MQEPRDVHDLTWPEGAGPPEPAVEPGDDGGERWIVSILGGADRQGRWKLARRAWVINFMGGADLDLTRAVLAGETVQMTVVSVMGGADICLPEHLNVEVSGVGIMGGTDVGRGPKRSLRERLRGPRPPQPPLPPSGAGRIDP